MNACVLKVAFLVESRDGKMFSLQNIHDVINPKVVLYN